MVGAWAGMRHNSLFSKATPSSPNNHCSSNRLPFWSDEVKLLVAAEEGFTLVLGSGKDLRSFREMI
ncbi:hypothetical protein D8674_026372 [Pyrus ussuriensis x Pyrus communis]|uniref:Uncharacterized protein n=1 Tax=Pyrus ussuriensis x Pyrus communis TaxID=2448454 RepID=A0A5N5I7R5_9ROSA|nr:hypothetical protein D8674_026372 [Pyrus ussuriensis x Pyrus communis]